MTLRIATLAASLGVALTVCAQVRAQEQPPVFRSAARLVHVSVVVQDRNGQAVPGLVASDFEIIEGGKRLPVAHFAVQAGEPSRRVAVGDGPHTFTNVVDGRIGTGATILLFDRLNTRDLDQERARQHIIAFLKGLRPEERIGFYILDPGEVRVLHDFTRDAAALLAVLDRTSRVTSNELAASEDKLPQFEPVGDGLDAQFEAWLLRAEQHMQGFYLMRRGEETANALELLANRLAAIPGRKNIIWVSSAFPLYFPDGIRIQSMSAEIYRATRALSHADVSIYPVDARGLEGAFAGHPADKLRPFTTMASQAPSFDTSSIIAEQTGGRVFRNTNDLRTAMSRAVEDASLTYLLGYYPVDQRWDGRFRKIEVKVARRGVNVRHRSGYYAHPPKVADAALSKNALVEALHYPLEATGLGLSVRVAPGSTPGTVSFAIIVDPSGLALEQKDGRWKGQVELAIGQRGGDGRLHNSAHVAVPLDIPNEMRAALVESGLTLNRTITLVPAARVVIVGVKDEGSGAIGTVRLDASRLRPLVGK